MLRNLPDCYAKISLQDNAQCNFRIFAKKRKKEDKLIFNAKIKINQKI
jgi:DNA-directed RNA polymerase subunit RPC12/RpoP